jgi:hypothetical protein
MDKKLPVDLLGEDAARRSSTGWRGCGPGFTDSVYANDIADLTIDTAAHGVEDVCAMIEARLTEGPGTAFERLRKAYPKPGL